MLKPQYKRCPRCLKVKALDVYGQAYTRSGKESDCCSDCSLYVPKTKT